MTNRPDDVQGRVPSNVMERNQLAVERMHYDEDNRHPVEHDTEAERLLVEHRKIIAKRCAWMPRIGGAIDQHGSWFSERAYWQFDWNDYKWIFLLIKSGEPTLMDVPDPDGDTCYVTECLAPIEKKIEGTDPDAVGQAAVEFIGQIKLPVQNVPMPMEREVHEGIQGSVYLDCRCKLSYGIALRDFIRFSPLGPWLPRRKEVQLLGYPMQL